MTGFRKVIERPSRERSGSRRIGGRGRPDVIHVLPEAALGGAERTVLDLLSSPTLTDLDQRVLFVSRKPNAVFPPELVVPQVGPPALGPVGAVLALVRARPRVAHGWLLRGNLTACLAKLLRRDLLVITSERNLGHTLTRSKRLAERLVALIENLATANSSAVRGAAVQRIPRRAGRFRVIAPGVTALRQDSVESTSGVMVGRLHPVKDHETALRAWTRVVRERTDATLAILGDGPERERLEGRIAALGLDSSVRLLGDRSPWPYLYGSRLFLSTSRAEGFSRAMLEALATGLPIVTTATGGSRELPDEATWLAAVGDDGKLAEHILALLADEEAREQAGRAALHGARELFSVTRCHEHYRALYASVGIG